MRGDAGPYSDGTIYAITFREQFRGEPAVDPGSLGRLVDQRRDKGYFINIAVVLKE
jgi:hypothetical protein